MWYTTYTISYTTSILLLTISITFNKLLYTNY